MWINRTDARCLDGVDTITHAVKSVISASLAPDARQNFIEGFSVGLLLELDMPQCLALGLIVFGSYGEQPASPAQQDLIAYIDRWRDDLQKPESLYLYQ